MQRPALNLRRGRSFPRELHPVHVAMVVGDEEYLPSLNADFAEAQRCGAGSGVSRNIMRAAVAISQSRPTSRSTHLSRFFRGRVRLRDPAGNFDSGGDRGHIESTEVADNKPQLGRRGASRRAPRHIVQRHSYSATRVVICYKLFRLLSIGQLP
jgi:hypothetical protein